MSIECPVHPKAISLVISLHFLATLFLFPTKISSQSPPKFLGNTHKWRKEGEQLSGWWICTISYTNLTNRYIIHGHTLHHFCNRVKYSEIKCHQMTILTMRDNVWEHHTPSVQLHTLPIGSLLLATHNQFRFVIHSATIELRSWHRTIHHIASINRPVSSREGDQIH